MDQRGAARTERGLRQRALELALERPLSEFGGAQLRDGHASPPPGGGVPARGRVRELAAGELGRRQRWVTFFY